MCSCLESTVIAPNLIFPSVDDISSKFQFRSRRRWFCLLEHFSATMNSLVLRRLFEIFVYIKMLFRVFKMIYTTKCASKRSATTSVTRFGEISPLWQNLKSLWQFFGGLYCIGRNVEPNWAKKLFWTNFHCCYWPIIENIN